MLFRPQEYKDGIAMLTQGGPVFFDPVTEKFSPLTDDPSVQKLISREYAFETFLIDSRHRMWLAVGGGKAIAARLTWLTDIGGRRGMMPLALSAKWHWIIGRKWLAYTGVWVLKLMNWRYLLR